MSRWDIDPLGLNDTEDTEQQNVQQARWDIDPLGLNDYNAPQIQQTPKEPSTIWQRAGDVGVSLLKGAIGVPEFFVGLADIPTFGYAGKAAEALGMKFKEAKDILDTWYTPEQQEANRKVQEAQGFFPTLQAMLENPSTIVQSVAESAPSMIGAGGIGRGVVQGVEKFLPKIATKIGGMLPVVGGAVGEGAVSAGQTLEQARQLSDTGLVTPTQVGTSALSGALTGAINLASGGLARKMGIADKETLMAGGGKNLVSDIEKYNRKSLLRKLVESGINEGLLQELPQSAQEQIAANLNAGKPWNEGVSEAAAQGLLTGAAMGMGGGVSASNIVKHQQQLTPDDMINRWAAGIKADKQNGVINDKDIEEIRYALSNVGDNEVTQKMRETLVRIEMPEGLAEGMDMANTLAEVNAPIENITEPITQPLYEKPVVALAEEQATTAPPMQEVAERASQRVAETPAIKPEELVNGITREELGKLIAKGDKKSIEHVKESIQKNGVMATEDAVINQIQSEIYNAKGKERDIVRNNIKPIAAELKTIFEEARQKEQPKFSITNTEGQQENIDKDTRIVVHYGQEARELLRGARTPEELNSYSNNLKTRMEISKDYTQFPFIPELNTYDTGYQKREKRVTWKKPHTIEIDNKDIYSINKDPEGLWAQAVDVYKSLNVPLPPDKALALKLNIFTNIAKDFGYLGYHVKGSEINNLGETHLFGEWKATPPSKLDFALSGQVQDLMKPATTLEEAVRQGESATPLLLSNIHQTMRELFPHNEIKVTGTPVYNYYSGGWTEKGEIEPSVSVTLEGSPVSIRTAALYLGLIHAQNGTMLTKQLAPENTNEGNGYLIQFKIKNGEEQNLVDFALQNGIKDVQLIKVEGGYGINAYASKDDIQEVAGLFKTLYKQYGEGDYDQILVYAEFPNKKQTKEGLVYYFGNEYGEEVYERGLKQEQEYRASRRQSSTGVSGEPEGGGGEGEHTTPKGSYSNVQPATELGRQLQETRGEEQKQKVAPPLLSLAEAINSRFEKTAITPDVFEEVKPTTEMEKGVERLCKAFKLKPIFWKSSHPLLRGVNGLYDPSKPDTVYINSQAKEPLMFVAGHELLHSLKTKHGDLYEKFSKYIEKHSSDFESYKQDLLKTYKSQGIQIPTEKGLWEEFLADYVGHEINNPDFWSKMYDTNHKLAHRIHNLIDAILTKIAKWTGLFKDKQHIKKIEATRAKLAEIMGEYASREKKQFRIDDKGNISIDRTDGVVFIGADMLGQDEKGREGGVHYPIQNMAFTTGDALATKIMKMAKETNKVVAIVAYKDLVNSFKYNMVYHNAIRKALNEIYGKRNVDKLFSEAEAIYQATPEEKRRPSVMHTALTMLNQYQPLEGKQSPFVGRETVYPSAFMQKIAKSIAVPDWEDISGKIVGVGYIKGREKNRDYTATRYPAKITFTNYYRLKDPIDFMDFMKKSDVAEKYKNAGVWVMLRNAGVWMNKRNNPIIADLVRAAKGDEVMLSVLTDGQQTFGHRVGEPTDYSEGLNRHQAGRGTGHFGSGTYFFSTEEKANKYRNALGGAVSVSKIDLKDKNLYKPANFNDGLELHDIMKKINDASFNKEHIVYSRYSDTQYPLDYDYYARKLNNLGISTTPEDIKKSMDEVYDIVTKEGFPKKDTASTRIMKRAGYDGVDVRHIPGLDNGTYGSVLYRRDELSPSNKEQSFLMHSVAPNLSPYANIDSKEHYDMISSFIDKFCRMFSIDRKLFNLYQSPLHFPENVSNKLKSGQRVWGWWMNGQAHINAAALSTEADTFKVALEEAIKHGYFEKVLDNGTEYDKNAIYSLVYKHYQDTPEMKRVIDDYDADVNTVKGRVLAGKEYFAHYYKQSLNEPSILNRVVNVIRNILRKMGINLGLNKTELDKFLKDTLASAVTMAREEGKVNEAEKIGTEQPSFLKSRAGEEAKFSFARSQPQSNFQRMIEYEPQRHDYSKQGIKKFFDDMYSKIFMKEFPLIKYVREVAGDDIARDIEQSIRRFRGRSYVVKEMLDGKGVLTYGKYGDEATKYIEGSKSLKDVLSPIENNEEYKDYESWRMARMVLALERYAPDYKMPEGLPAMAREEIARLNDKYGEKITKFREVDKDHRAFEKNAILKPLLDVGWLSQEQYDRILNSPTAEYYASLQRVIDGVDNAFGGKEPIKRRYGTEKEYDFIPSTESTIANVVKTVKLVESQKINKYLAKLREMFPDMQATMVETKPAYREVKIGKVAEVDPAMRAQLNDLVRSLGATAETLDKIGRDRLGAFSPNDDRILLKFASSERTYAHELGHLLDKKYNLVREFITGTTSWAQIKKELRAIADQRLGGESSDYFKKYVRKRSEQIAELVARYLTQPEQAKALAPNAVKKLEAIIHTHPELKPLLEIKPSGQQALAGIEGTIKVRSDIPPKGTIVVAEDGVKKYYTLPPDVLKAIDFYKPNEISAAVKLLSYPARTLRAGATTSVDFVFRNMIRDQFSAMTYAKYGYLPFWDFAKGLAHVLKKDDLFHEWQASGAGEAFLFSIDRLGVNTQARDLLKHPGLRLKTFNPLEALRYLSGLSEMGTRLGVYAKARKKGASTLEAASEAREATVDFNRMGGDASMRALNMIAAFFNANLQGMDLMRRKMFSKEGLTTKEGGKRWLKVFMGITLPSIILWAVNHDDDRYKELPAWQKDLFWIIIPPGKDSPIIRIPKPFELGILFGSLPERMLSWMYDKDPRAMKDIAKSIIDNGLASPIPTAAVPIVENMTNYSFFTDRPLENETLRNLPAGERATANTTELAKKFGKITNISPIQLENMIQGWSGSLGKKALQVVSMPFKGDVPPVDKKIVEASWFPLPGLFSREPIGSISESVNNFYKIYEQTQQHETAYKNMGKAGRTDEAKEYLEQHKADISIAKQARNVSTILSSLRKQVVAVQNDKIMSPETKREKIDRLQKQMTNISKQFVNKYDVLVKRND